MNRTISYGVAACLLVAGGAMAVAVTAQDSTQQPGQPTQARMWIQNRGEAEAVPVSIQNALQPLRVELTTVPTVMIAADSVVQARATRQQWEYRDIRIPAGQSPAAVLNAAGADGWETAGVAITDQAATVVVMKRPR